MKRITLLLLCLATILVCSSFVKKGEVQYGKASYYADYFHGKLTANGETFDMNDISAAHKTLPFNTVVRVTNLNNNKSVLVRINDRGPYINGRIIDLSKGAGEELGMIDNGVIKCKVEIVQTPKEYMRSQQYQYISTQLQLAERISLLGSSTTERYSLSSKKGLKKIEVTSERPKGYALVIEGFNSTDKLAQYILKLPINDYIVYKDFTSNENLYKVLSKPTTSFDDILPLEKQLAQHNLTNLPLIYF